MPGNRWLSLLLFQPPLLPTAGLQAFQLLDPDLSVFAAPYKRSLDGTESSDASDHQYSESFK
jgi:hypothetical protein